MRAAPRPCLSTRVCPRLPRNTCIQARQALAAQAQQTCRRMRGPHPSLPNTKKHERSLTSRRRRPTCGALPLQVMPEASHTLTWGTRPRVGEWQPPEPAMARPAPPDPRPKGRSEGLLARARVAHAGHLHGRQSPPRNPTRSHPLAPRALSQGLRYRLGPLPRVSGLGELVRVPAPAAQLRETSLARVGHQTTDRRVPPLCLLVWVSAQWPVVVMDPIDVEGGARANFEASTIAPSEKLLVVSLDDALEQGKPSL